MRKLTKDSAPKKRTFPVVPVIKAAGAVLFALGLVPLFALIRGYTYAAGFPGWSVAVMAAELAAGGVAVKCASLPKYAGHVMIAAVAPVACTLLSMLFSDAAVQWPAVTGCAAACVLLAGGVFRFVSFRS
jgi:hypothetical protein